MPTPFEKVYDKFFLQIGDDSKVQLMKLTQDELDELLYSMLEESMVSFKRCKKKLTDIDNILMQFNVDLDLEETSILALGLVLVWLRPQVLRLQNLKQNLGDRDFKKTSNWQTLNSLISLKKDTENELKQKISDYTYNSISDIEIKR